MIRRWVYVCGLLAFGAAAPVGAGAYGQDAARAPVKVTPMITDRDVEPFGLTVQWTSFTPLGADVKATGIYAYDKELMVADSDTRLISYDVKDGSRLWLRQLDNPRQPIFEPVVDQRDVFLLVGGNLVVLDRQQGRERWRAKVGNIPAAGPAVAGGFVYVAGADGWLRAYSRTTHQQEWYFNARAPLVVKPIPVGLETQPLICLVAKNKKVYAMSNKERVIVWEHETDGELVATPAQVGKNLYVPCADFNLYALDTANYGAVSWVFRSGSQILDPPVVVGATLYFPSFRNGFYAVRRTDGQKRWWRETGVKLLSVGRQRCYLLDAEQAILVCDKLTGKLEGRFVPPKGYTWMPTNVHSDAVYLMSEDGLIACLRERVTTTGEAQPEETTTTAPAP